MGKMKSEHDIKMMIETNTILIDRSAHCDLADDDREKRYRVRLRAENDVLDWVLSDYKID
jgi:hypothetical protein